MLSRVQRHTFCCRQSLHALFTPGWCRGFEVVGLDSEPSSPFVTALSELLLRFRGDPSSSGDALVGDACCGDWTAPGGSNETPLCQAIAPVSAWLDVYASGVGRDSAEAKSVLTRSADAPHHVEWRNAHVSSSDGEVNKLNIILLCEWTRCIEDENLAWNKKLYDEMQMSL